MAETKEATDISRRGCGIYRRSRNRGLGHVRGDAMIRRITFALVLAIVILCGTSLMLIPRWVADEYLMTSTVRKAD